MWFLDTLVGINAVGTWRGAGHAKRTTEQLRLQNQMLFDAMTEEEKARVLGAAAERQRAHAQMLQEGRDRAFMWRVGIWVVVLLAGAMALVSKPTSTMQRVLESKPPAVAVQPVAKPKEKTCWIYDRSMEMCLSGWE